MLGYLDRPQETAAMIDDDGWIHTGDLGHVDAGGNVVVVDRLKELIKVNALQVAPAEVEAALTSYPDVRDAAVIARPDERTGEVPVAFIVAEPSIDIAALERWIATRLAGYKRPAEIQLVHELPRTPSGKPLRRQLTATGAGARS
jgi:acyl-CoA synthetase (AMP-forming)/AMP-acid ligase II